MSFGPHYGAACAFRDSIAAIIVRQKSSSRSTRSEMVHTHISIEGQGPGQLKLSFSVQITAFAPAARAADSISRTSWREYR